MFEGHGGTAGIELANSIVYFYRVCFNDGSCVSIDWQQAAAYFAFEVMKVFSPEANFLNPFNHSS